MTARNNLHWGIDSWYGQNNNLSYTYQNNRITNTGWTYDADGRVTQSATPDDPATSTYDARGLLIKHHVSDNYSSSYGTIHRFYNGDGREVKRGKVNYAEIYDATQWPLGNWTEEEPTYGEIERFYNGDGCEFYSTVVEELRTLNAEIAEDAE